MHYRRLGGLVSELCFGTMTFGNGEGERLLVIPHFRLP
jgi:aryl-alcohol dehydrogenase-like predicted oxidoreductase